MQQSINQGLFRMDKETLRMPMKRVGLLEEIGDSIAFLASPMSSYMTGSTLVVDG